MCIQQSGIFSLRFLHGHLSKSWQMQKVEPSIKTRGSWVSWAVLITPKRQLDFNMEIKHEAFEHWERKKNSHISRHHATLLLNFLQFHPHVSTPIWPSALSSACKSHTFFSRQPSAFVRCKPGDIRHEKDPFPRLLKFLALSYDADRNKISEWPHKPMLNCGSSMKWQ